MLKIALAALLAAALAGSAALAAGSSDSPSPSPSPSSSAPSPYDQAVGYIEAHNYAKAIPLLEQVTKQQPRNADAWNYLGFAYRSVDRYDDAFVAYDQALKIDPEHDGANEYLGELYLMTGDLASAEKQLEVLDGNCSFSCTEYHQLKDAIAQYKAKHGS